MTDDYRAAAEQLLNRLRGQGRAPTAQFAEPERRVEGTRAIIINNPSHCTIIVNNHGGPPNPKGPQQ